MFVWRFQVTDGQYEFDTDEAQRDYIQEHWEQFLDSTGNDDRADYDNRVDSHHRADSQDRADSQHRAGYDNWADSQHRAQHRGDSYHRRDRETCDWELGTIDKTDIPQQITQFQVNIRKMNLMKSPIYIDIQCLKSREDGHIIKEITLRRKGVPPAWMLVKSPSNSTPAAEENDFAKSELHSLD